MGARARLVRCLRLAALLLPLAVLLAACVTDNPQNALTDRGEVSDTQRDLFYITFWIAVGVFFAVEGLMLFIMYRFRERRGHEGELPVQTHGNTRLEVGWTILPAALLAFLTIPTIDTIVDLSRRPDDALHVRVIAHQWWFEFRYAGPNNTEIITANEMHIPVRRRVLLTIESSDVIHSFWVPNLAGKQDAVPGHSNDIWLNARDPGVYSGQCAEFCGESHAVMRFLVIAEPQDAFDRWLADQARPATTPLSGSAARGAEVFLGNACIGCHAIGGTNAQGRTAPDLTHFGSRSTIAANRLPNTPEELERWIRNAPAVKPGAKMPVWEGVLSDADIKAIVDYLESLK